MLEQASETRIAPPRIESLLSNRLFLVPQLIGNRLYFISNLSGAFSLYVMDEDGSVPEPLLPPDIALQNPELLDTTYSFYVFANLGRIVVMIDRDGDENYQPMVIPIDGGIPEPAFGDQLMDYRVHLLECDPETSRVYLATQSRSTPMHTAFTGRIDTGELELLRESVHGSYVSAVNADHTRVVLIDGYLPGDEVLFLWERGAGVRRLYGTPVEDRAEGQQVEINAINNCSFTSGDRGLLCTSALFDDAFSPTYLDLQHPEEARPVTLTGIVHQGSGQLDGLAHLHDDRYRLSYNIDGVSWVYEGRFAEEELTLHLERVLVGQGPLANGTLESIQYDPASDRYALSFSTATSPTQLFILEGPHRAPTQKTRERILGVPSSHLSPGEDASFHSFDGTRISARLYLPASELGVAPPYPLVYYIHGGPQSQERPNFAWFSMPLIQYLTLSGFAVFVPNVRGSTGYGLSYMKQVDHDWGGQDRLDHVHAMTQILPADTRLDVHRAGVMGRSYGGYMTLTMASRHPELFKAACDMFGPSNLITFTDRLPEPWKPYMRMQVGDAETERDFVLERSPATYLEQLRCPLLVIQGQNDPRVVEQESHALVVSLKEAGKEVEYLLFPDEGHDVLKFPNRVRCYTAITQFFTQHL